MAILSGGGLALSLLRNGVASDVSVNLGDLLLVLVLVVAGAEAFGLPRPLAMRLGIGFRSRAWEFDHRIYRYKERLDRLLLAYPSPPDWTRYRRWQSRVARDGRVLLRKMASLHAPDGDWASVRDDYVGLYDGILTGIANDHPPDDPQTFERGTEIALRADRLRITYRAEAESLLQQSRAARILRGRR
jgi:hypothetical protein